jgi:hypothetical protein
MTTTLNTDTNQKTRIGITRIYDPRTLRILRVSWVLVVVIGLSLFTLGMPRYYATILVSARYTPYEPILQQLGLDMPFLAGWLTGFDVVQAIICTLIALFIFSRRSDDWLALLISQTIFFAGFSFSFAIAQLEPLVGGIIVSLGFLMLIVPINLFPDGMFRPRWIRWVTIVAIPYFIATIPLQASALDVKNVGQVSSLYGLAVLGAAIILLLGVVGQVMRYMRHATALQRQQTKFIVAGAVAAFVFFLIKWLSAAPAALAHPYAAPDRAVYTLPSLIVLFFARPVDALSLLVIPIAFAFAILRARLWDIDLVINRSLVYGLVTVVMGMVFVGGSLLIQQILGESQSTLAIAISVIVAGALFNPSRKYAQRVIDRRLYGFRFDLNQLENVQKKELAKPDVQNAGRLTGQLFNGYELLGVVGKGGMGEVYKAFKDGTIFAVKVLPEMWMDSDDAKGRFTREAEITMKLNHQHIVRVYEHGVLDGNYFMVMDFIEGTELNKHIKNNGALDIIDTLTIVADIASALDYAHEKNLVHRDLKPSNIILKLNPDMETYSAILLDFGIAKSEDTGTRLTGTGAIGTIDYMAPEQIREAKAVDHRADIYGLGVVVYEMLTAHRPFNGSPAQVMFAHLQQPPPDLRDTISDIPRHIALAVARALSKDAEDRQKSAGDFARSLVMNVERKEA